MIERSYEVYTMKQIAILICWAALLQPLMSWAQASKPATLPELSASSGENKVGQE
jgi:hypothetical protein